MKRVISLILAIVMIALLAPMVISADEIKTVDASCPEDANEKVVHGQWTITKKYFAVSYSMNYVAEAGKKGNNGCNGITLGDNDSTGCVFIPYGDSGEKKAPNKIIWFGPWWNGSSPFGVVNDGAEKAQVNIADYVGKDITVLLVGSYENKKLTVKAYLNGNQIKAWKADEYAVEDFNGKIGWATKVSGLKATAKFVESDKALDKTAFDAKAPTTGVKVGPSAGKWTVDGKNYINTEHVASKNGSVYVLGKSNDFELTAKVDTTDKQFGFIFNGKDVDGDGVFTEDNDQYMIVWMKNNQLRVITSDKGWNRYNGGTTDEVNWGNSNIPTAQGEFELKLVYKNYTVEVFVNGQKAGERKMDKGHEFGGWIGTWSKVSGAAYKDLTLTVHDAQNPPRTGEATAIVAVIAVLTLAGTMVAAKKRH